MAVDPSGTVRWGVFEFDPSTGRLTKHGREVRLPEQPAVALGLLLSRSGELVSREQMRAALWPDGTFVDFENGINVAINRVRDALGDSASSPRFIETVPRRGHRFIAPVSRIGPPLSPSDAPVPSLLPEPVSMVSTGSAHRPWWRRPVTMFLATGLTAGMLAVVAARRPALSVAASDDGPSPSPPPHLTRLTSFPGIEACPGLSPDGEQVAFAWTPESGEPAKLWVTIIGSADKRQLTFGAGWDGHPAWSSDGRFVAFIRYTDEGARLHIVSAVGGTSRKVADFPAGGQLAWSPDDRYLLSGRSEGPEKGIWAVPVDGGEPWLVVAAPPGGGARAVALSPDRGRMAYASCRTVSDDGYFDCDADVVPLDASLRATGPPVSVARMPTLGGPTWTRDGRALVFFGDSNGSNETRLFRADVGSKRLGTVDAAGLTVGLATTTRANDRLVFVRFELDVDLAVARRGHPAAPIAVSSADEQTPSFGPDGRHIAFTSARTGRPEIWIADASGADPRQLTHGPGPAQQTPRWSPDGRLVAFESRAADGHSHVWVSGSDGTAQRQLTDGAGDEGGPTWSADGRYVYFCASRGQGYDIWRVPVAGGARERMTTHGSGYLAFAAPDGHGIVYQQATSRSALLLQREPGGPSTQIVGCSEVNSFVSNRGGIYYIPCGQGHHVALHRAPSAGVRDQRMMTLDGINPDFPGLLDVSPNARTVLFARQVNARGGGDLWMIDPFR